MTQEAVKIYTTRISQANASKLLCIAYDLWQEFAKEVLDAFEQEDWDTYKLSIRKLQRVNQEIIVMLNGENQVAKDVKAIHFFANRKITDCMLKQHVDDIDRLMAMMKSLQTAFSEISKQDFDAPLMEHTQQVYAGLTYGKGTLNESIDPMGQSPRGYTI